MVVMFNDLNKVCETAKGMYLVVDLYEGWVEVLYDGNSLHDAKKARRWRIEDTDGECCVRILVKKEEY